MKNPRILIVDDAPSSREPPGTALHRPGIPDRINHLGQIRIFPGAGNLDSEIFCPVDHSAYEFISGLKQ